MQCNVCFHEKTLVPCFWNCAFMMCHECISRLITVSGIISLKCPMCARVSISSDEMTDGVFVEYCRRIPVAESPVVYIPIQFAQTIQYRPGVLRRRSVLPVIHNTNDMNFNIMGLIDDVDPDIALAIASRTVRINIP